MSYPPTPEERAAKAAVLRGQSPVRPATIAVQPTAASSTATTTLTATPTGNGTMNGIEGRRLMLLRLS